MNFWPAGSGFSAINTFIALLPVMCSTLYLEMPANMYNAAKKIPALRQGSL